MCHVPAAQERNLATEPQEEEEQMSRWLDRSNLCTSTLDPQAKGRAPWSCGRHVRGASQR